MKCPKLATEDNDWKLWSVLERYTDTQFVAAFKNFFVNKTEIWDDCFARGQLQSKAWLVRELKELDPNLAQFLYVQDGMQHLQQCYLKMILILTALEVLI